jgi:thiamine biosynthesis lipoprotein
MPSPKFSNKPKPSITLAFEAIGTLWRIKYTGEESEALAMSDAISQRILTFDTHYSRFRSDSLVTQLSKHLATTQMPDDFAPLIQFYRKLYDVTDGLVTPLIGLALSDAGYDTHYSFQPRSIRPTPAWDDALTYKNNQLSVRQSVMLDFGAAGKGYLVDILANILQERGIYEYTIDAGGDIAHHGTDPNYVGLEDPTNTTMVIGITELTNRSICGSAGNRRRWEGYTHILNPLTRQSPTDITAIWVIADTTMLADGLATALSFVEPVALSQFHFEYLLIYPDGRRQASPGFPVRYFDEPKIYELT